MATEIEKNILLYEEKFIGKECNCLHRYEHGNDMPDIIVCDFTNSPSNDVCSYTTIGLHNVDIGLTSGGKKLRVELIGATYSEFTDFADIMSMAAHGRMESKRCCPGFILLNSISYYLQGSDMKHILMTIPTFWDDEIMVIDDTIISWLMILPISDNEYKYAQENGTEALEKLLEKNKVNVLIYIANQ